MGGIVLMQSNSYVVEPYRLLNGFPVFLSPESIDAHATLTLGAPNFTDGFLDPASMNLAPASRWLPNPGTLAANAWLATEGSAPFGLSSDATTPALDMNYAYFRGKEWIGNQAIRLDGGDHFWADGLPWNKVVTFLAVVVLRPPVAGSYGVFETSDSAGNLDATRSYVSLRYGHDGVLRTYCRGLLSASQTASGAARPGQAMVVGLSIDAMHSEITVITCDRTARFHTLVLPNQAAPDARLYVGRSDADAFATAECDILELDAWFDDTISAHDLSVRVHAMDAVYGVSA